MFSRYAKLRALKERDQRELIEQHDAEIVQMLPLLGPLFGLGVVLFGVWDYVIDPAQLWLTLPIRIALVLLGSIAYRPTRLGWTPQQRCGFIYGTHAGAIIICEFLLRDGFLYGLAGISACVFAVSVITLRTKTFFLILGIPSVLFVVLCAASTPWLGFVNSLMLYLFAVSVAWIIMLVIRSFRQKAFLFEKELLHISRHDSLTGAYNRRYLTELAEREVALAKRHCRPLAVAMIDIDHFKKINDTYGHDVGDTVLKKLVETCTANLRGIDHFGRTGGEEFVCIMPETDAGAAMICAERLRWSIEAIRMNIPRERLQFTVSIGIAVLALDHADWNDLIRDADMAMYRAKREGRNRVMLANAGSDSYPL